MPSTSPTADPDRAQLPWADDEDEQPRRSRAWLLGAAATVPWVVVAIVLVRPDPAPPAAPAPPAPATPPATARATPESAAAPASTPAPADTPVPGRVGLRLRSTARHGPAVGDAVAVATLVARGWLGTATPRLDGPVPARPVADRYAEHLVVEAVDQPAPGDVVVTLVATVLDLGGGEPVVGAVRLAVPVRLDRSGARPAGEPWPLPAPDLTLDPPATTAVDDPDLLVAAGEALTAAGYEVREVTALERTDGWPWVAVADVVGPGGEPREGARVWLRRHLGAFVVAGWLPAPRVRS